MRFDCGICHTSNYDPKGVLEGMPGSVGSWTNPSVACERCHDSFNPQHISPEIEQTTKDILEDVWLCGKCHIWAPSSDILFAQTLNTLRAVESNKTLINLVTDIDAKEGMIREFQQFEEWYNSPHREAGITCQTCHEPHTQKVIKNCGDCHIKQEALFEKSLMRRIGVTCTDCHMPKAVKSVEGSANIFYGDFPSHLWKINKSSEATLTDPTDKHVNPFLPLGWTCSSPGCHGTSKLLETVRTTTTVPLHMDWDTAKVANVVSDIQRRASTRLDEADQDLKEAMEALRQAEEKGVVQEDLVELLGEASETVQLIKEDGTMVIHNPSGALKDLEAAITIARQVTAGVEVIPPTEDEDIELCSRCHIFPHEVLGTKACLRCHETVITHEKHRDHDLICETCHDPTSHSSFEEEPCAQCHGVNLALLRMPCEKCHTAGGLPSTDCFICHEEMLSKRAEAISDWASKTIAWPV